MTSLVPKTMLKGKKYVANSTAITWAVIAISAGGVKPWVRDDDLLVLLMTKLKRCPQTSPIK
jgi:hypothetical protein